MRGDRGQIEVGRSVPEPESASVGFEIFFEDRYRQTVRLAHLLTGVDAVAEDLAQDAFARVHRHYTSLANPGGYLHTTTVNVCRNWHRGRWREAVTFSRLPVATTSAPSRVFEELLDAVDGLPYRQRAVLVLRYWLDLRERDVAEILGCRLGTVKSLHARALAGLRKKIVR